MDFFDDFGWEEMAMAGGLGEEMSEEDREQRRLAEEAGNPWQDDTPEEAITPAEWASLGKGPRARRPFEQYVDDHVHGRKQIGDPLLGPSRSIGGAASTNATILGVPVRNANLVSEKFLRFVLMALQASPGHDVRGVYFDDRGRPVVDNRPVFAIFDAGTRTIHINLVQHLENAIRIAECRVSCFSIRQTLWNSMQEVLLHEIKHALDTAKNSAVNRLDKKEQDRIAVEWAGEVLTVLAMNYDVEPPNLSEEPYFGPLIVRHLDRAVETGGWVWAKKQKQMLAEGVLYQDPFFTIRTEKEYFTLSAAGLRGDPRGKKFNALVTYGLQLLNEAWDAAEVDESLLRQAVSTGTRLRIEHRVAEGRRETCVIQPAAVVKKGPFLWVEARVEPNDSPAAFRIDRIVHMALP